MFRVAVIGATGVVGQELLGVLRERKFPLAQLDVVASAQSAGRELDFGAETLQVQALTEYDFSATDIALFAAGGSIAKEFAPKAAKAGCVVIDNSSHFRQKAGIPLIVPEVNGTALKDFKKHNIIANPNCSTAQLVVVLKPLHDIAQLQRVVVATYQAVSGAGRGLMDTLFNETRALYASGDDTATDLPKPMAFNLIPQIGDFDDNGDSFEEAKMRAEVKKILDSKIELTATCVRVPVFVGHSEAVNLAFAKPITDKQARTALRQAAGVEVVDERKAGGYITPKECAGKDPCYVSRLRKDLSQKNALNLWVVADNLRKGAALNAVQIAELLIAKHIKPRKQQAAE